MQQYLTGDHLGTSVVVRSLLRGSARELAVLRPGDGRRWGAISDVIVAVVPPRSVTNYLPYGTGPARHVYLLHGAQS